MSEQMSREFIQNSIREILEDRGHINDTDSIQEETSLPNDLGLDSLDSVEFIMDVERTFNISIPDEEAESVTTVGQCIDLIVKKLQ